MTNSFDRVWAEIREALVRQPRCPLHPDYPSVSTLANGTPNDVLSVSEATIELRSHRKGSNDQRTVPKAALRAYWEHLVKNGTAALVPGHPNNPVSSDSKILGAILGRCLPDRVEYVRDQDAIRLRTTDLPTALPEEIPDPTGLTEGAVRRITVNAYERDATARRLCLAAHGTNCHVCDLNFGEAYGPEAEGYIHVHHLRPLSEIRAEYEVNPVKDLCPVCPNCHAVLHLGGRCRSIQEVRRMLRR